MRKPISFAALALTALLAIPGVAHASHEQVKITEVYTGSAGSVNSEYVELQMYADGESNFVPPNGAYVAFYKADGTLNGLPLDFASNPIGGNQRKVLAISNQAYLEFVTPTPDLLFGDGNLLDPDGGAVCFASDVYNVLPFIDCVSYGNFVNTTATLPVGTNAPAPTTTQSIHRTIESNCPTQLEAADDTDVSLVDFALGAPNPTPSGVGPNLPGCTPPGGNPVATTPAAGSAAGLAAGPTGQRAAALKKCKKKKGKSRKKCMKKARNLPA